MTAKLSVVDSICVWRRHQWSQWFGSGLSGSGIERTHRDRPGISRRCWIQTLEEELRCFRGHHPLGKKRL